MFKRIILAAAAAIMMASCATHSTEECGRKLDSELLNQTVSNSQNARIDDGKLTGSHVIIRQYGKDVLNRCYGLKSVQGGDSLTNEAVYRIASMTKPVTSFALLMEHDRGHLDLNDDLSKYLPEFAEMYLPALDEDCNCINDAEGHKVKGEKAQNSIKLYQLVSHTSGVGEVRLSHEEMASCNLDKAVEYLAAQPLDYEPSTRQAYSTGAFDLAARVIENVSGMEFGEYLEKNIFKPLGMTNTTFEPSADQWQRLVAIHARGEDGKSCDGNFHEGCVFSNFPAQYHAAGAALASTAEDYAKFAQMLLDGGKTPKGKRLVSEESMKLYSTPVVDDTVMPGVIKWGLGVRVVAGDGYTLPKGSFGWSGAYGSHFWVDPSNGLIAVYMKNSSYDGGAGAATGSELEHNVMDSLEK